MTLSRHGGCFTRHHNWEKPTNKITIALVPRSSRKLGRGLGTRLQVLGSMWCEVALVNRRKRQTNIMHVALKISPAYGPLFMRHGVGFYYRTIYRIAPNFRGTIFS